MNYLLLIDTAVETASVCLAAEDRILGEKENAAQRDHAAWLQPAIRDLCTETGIPLSGLSAIAVSAGPGSYTGLRVGMAAAKGLCYALGLPLITLNSLQGMAAAAAARLPGNGLLCPMIDARRMEVFTAVYNHALEEIISPHNALLDADSFAALLKQNEVIFFGNGSHKWKPIVTHKHAAFENVRASASAMMPLAWASWRNRSFAELAYCEPFYIKEFYSPILKRNL
ncbi:MAG TPA: tRNA (adenosine(37)-N6)-threonylcarbamoyltransferase complex dimerization subunit type 1 TsaB [Chitinophagaceae bacterium]|nr:tRNA (adenosine(37)-N6)-threonylcarbamoyltransferase complex dimerization subunit type 1 TsaB [Chitinophagaceae bacterium]